MTVNYCAIAHSAIATTLGLLILSGCGASHSEPVTIQSNALVLTVAVEPVALRVGQNVMWLELRDTQGEPIPNAELDVQVRMHAMGAMPAMGGPAAVSEVGRGRYRADFELVMGSTWVVDVAARAPGRAPIRAEGSLTVGTPGLRLAAAGADAPAEPSPAAGTRDVAARSELQHPAEFRVAPGRLQRIGVRTVRAEQRSLVTGIRAVGRILADETTLEDVSLKVRGWAGQVFADALGEPVRKGEPLFSVYSPELYAAQEEYLQALRSQERARATQAPERADYLVRAARKRLELWDIAPRDVEQIARTGEPLEQLPIRARTSGFIVEKNLVSGGAFEAGQRLYRIAPLTRVWVEAEVYESELALVREGQAAQVTLPSQPQQHIEATVAYVYPTLDPRTRTARVRLELPNPDLALRPDMYANVLLRAERGERLLVPQSAVLYAGERSFVFRALGDGRFRPQQVEVGLRGGDDVEILSGLAAGENIVSSGTFLIASESRLRAALEQW